MKHEYAITRNARKRIRFGEGGLLIGSFIGMTITVLGGGGWAYPIGQTMGILLSCMCMELGMATMVLKE
jgi:hypothetical protein